FKRVLHPSLFTRRQPLDPPAVVGFLTLVWHSTRLGHRDELGEQDATATAQVPGVVRAHPASSSSTRATSRTPQCRSRRRTARGRPSAAPSGNSAIWTL